MRYASAVRVETDPFLKMFDDLIVELKQHQVSDENKTTFVIALSCCYLHVTELNGSALDIFDDEELLPAVTTHILFWVDQRDQRCLWPEFTLRCGHTTGCWNEVCLICGIQVFQA